MQLVALSLTAAITFTGFSLDAHAATSDKVTKVMPQAGITYALGNNQVSLSNLQQSIDEEKAEEESIQILTQRHHQPVQLQLME